MPSDSLVLSGHDKSHLEIRRVEKILEYSRRKRWCPKKTDSNHESEDE